MLRIAPALFVLLWSSGWLTAKAAMPYAEPLTFLAGRYGLAALILVVACAVQRVEGPRTRAELGHALVSGVFLYAMYFGGVWWSVMHGLPVAISGLITALQPLLTAMLAPSLLGEAITRRQMLGVVLGFAGIVMVLSPALAQIPPEKFGDMLVPLAVNVVGTLGVTFGTFYQKRFVTSGDLRAVTALQNVGALAVTLPLAMATETMHITWNVQTVATMAWVVIAMSIGAVVLLMLLIRHGAVSRAATLIYLIPPIVAVQAVLLFDETLTPIQMIGMGVTALGVALAVRKT